MSDTDNPPSGTPVSVIVPIYKNLAATRNCIESLASTSRPANVQVTMIVDGSPDPELVQYCRSASTGHGFDILVNDSNRGFVHTANEGMQLHPHADVILLNSDTVVSGDWVQRLQRCADSMGKAGTVTPFSNNGTICSYPVFPLANELPPGWDSRSLDTLVSQANAGQSHPIPTAVGFCMYIKRQCLTETGLFDEQNFGLGYGEECDFCLRASKLGWQHLLAADVFVFHEGAASFKSESDRRKQEADEVMARLHPEYDELVTKFIHQDPLQPLRLRIDTQRILDRPSDLAQVMLEHSEHSAALRRDLARERDNTNQVKAKTDKLESLLATSRAEFQQVDASLKTTQATLDEAHAALDTLGENFTQVQSEAQVLHAQVQELAKQLDTVASQLHASQDENRSLRAELEKMVASRSWRYTKWLRRSH